MTLVGIEGGFSRDHLVNVHHGARFSAPGGPGTYAALAAAVTLEWLGATSQKSPDPRSGTRVFGSGADFDISELLDSRGIDTSWLPLDRAPKLWILTSESGRRIVRADSHRGHELQSDQPEFEPAPRPPAGFLMGLDALLRCAPSEPAIRVDPETVVAVDPDQRQIAARGWEYLEELARTTTLFLPSRVQLTQLHPDPLHAAELIRERTGRAVVARADADGSYVLPVTGEVVQVAALPTQVIDTTGAGDSHAAALLAAFSSQPDRDDLVRAAAIASVVAARTVSGWGPDPLLNVNIHEIGDVDEAIAMLPTTSY